jgi:hypothetical protein
VWCIAALVLVAAVYGSGCADSNVPRIDPTGEHILATDPVGPQAYVNQPPSYVGDRRESSSTVPSDDAQVTLTPTELTAPVGSEVILVAGVVAVDGSLVAHRRLEWTLMPGSVGQFAEISQNNCIDRLLGDNNPHKVAAVNYAVGGTGHAEGQVTPRIGPAANVANVTVGQGWVGLTSTMAGDSVVTVIAPQVFNSATRQKIATIHWRNTGLTAPAIGPIPAAAAPVAAAGGTTAIGPTPRPNPGAPAGGGPAAGAAATGGAPAGAASVGGAAIEMRVSEPPPTPVGNVARFVILVTNRGTQPSPKLRLYDMFEPGLQSNRTQQNHLDLDLGVLGPNQQTQAPLDFKVLQAGDCYHTVKVLDPSNKALAVQRSRVVGIAPATVPGGQGGAGPGASQPTGRYGEVLSGGSGADAARQEPRPPGQGAGQGAAAGGSGAAIGGPNDLSIKVTGPPSKLMVRELAPFTIEIKNTSTRTLNNLKVEALLDPVFERAKASATQGFWHDKATGTLCYIEPSLKPNQRLTLDIQTQCLQASPRATAYVRVSSDDGARTQGEAQCEIVAAEPPVGQTPAGQTPAGQSFSGPPAGTREKSSLQLIVTCPTNPARAGKPFNCLVTVMNVGNEDERNVAVEVAVPEGLVVVPMGTNGPDAAKVHIEKGIVRFDPIAAVPPGQPQRYRVLVQTKTARSYTFAASAKSDKQATPIRQEQSVDVTP